MIIPVKDFVGGAEMKQAYSRAVMAFVRLGVVIACGGQPQVEEAGKPGSGLDAAARFRVEVVVSNLEIPWSIVFAPDGRMFFTERPGRVPSNKKPNLC